MWHELKTWPDEFEMTKSGTKTFEVRKNDRDFSIGDYLVLREYSPDFEEYSGRSVTRYVQHILYGPKFGLPDDLVVMAVVPV